MESEDDVPDPDQDSIEEEKSEEIASDEEKFSDEEMIPETYPSSDSPPIKVRPIVSDDRANRADLVAYYFSRGHSIPQILRLLKRDHGIEHLNRDIPYQDLAFATNARWLTYSPPLHLEYSNAIQRQYRNLMKVYVPSDGGRMAVVSEGANIVFGSMVSIAEKLADEYGAEWDFPNEPAKTEPRRTRVNQGTRDEKPTVISAEDGAGDSNDPRPLPLILEIRIGVCGGRTMGETIYSLGQLLIAEMDSFEKKLKKRVFRVCEASGRKHLISEKLVRRRFQVQLKLLFINLTPGFDTSATNQPIGFLTAMINSHESLSNRANVMCFSGDPYTKIEEYQGPSKIESPQREVRQFIEKWGLDIILTSTGSIEDSHSALSAYYGNDPASLEIFKNHGVNGDICLMPIGPSGPFHFADFRPEERDQLKYRPMTLYDLNDVASHRNKKCDVVLIVAPCGDCYGLKDKVVKSILDCERPLVSHLILDRGTAAALTERLQ